MFLLPCSLAADKALAFSSGIRKLSSVESAQRQAAGSRWRRCGGRVAARPQAHRAAHDAAPHWGAAAAGGQKNWLVAWRFPPTFVYDFADFYFTFAADILSSESDVAASCPCCRAIFPPCIFCGFCLSLCVQLAYTVVSFWLHMPAVWGGFFGSVPKRFGRCDPLGGRARIMVVCADGRQTVACRSQLPEDPRPPKTMQEREVFSMNRVYNFSAGPSMLPRTGFGACPGRAAGLPRLRPERDGDEPPQQVV